MTDLSLTYFDFDGGRGEPIRLALHIADIPFEDIRFPMSDFAEVRKTTPFGQVPVMEVNGQVITQSNALLRFVGQQADLYPEDIIDALLVDEVLDVVEDMTSKIVSTFGMQGDELKAAREALIEGPYNRYVEWLSDRLVAQGNGFFSGDTLSIADLKAWVWLRTLTSGIFDHIPADWLATKAPLLADYVELIAQYPEIHGYYANR